MTKQMIRCKESERDRPVEIEVPSYGAAMELISRWEEDGLDFAWLIPRLYRLWSGADDKVCGN